MAWEYQELLNQNLQITFLLILGACSIYFKVFRQNVDLKTFNTFVFVILLPASVLTGLGMRSNLRDGAVWRFVGGFLMLRAICLLGSCAVFFRRGVGEVAANWLFFCWVSTVILGVPLIRAALGAQYANLGVVAGISSFVFQLPVMLVMMEIHRGQQVQPTVEVGTLPTSIPSNTASNRAAEESTSEKRASSSSFQIQTQADGNGAGNGTHALQDGDASSPQRSRWLTRAQGKAILRQISHNAILWAILIGIILSVTRLGPKYLYPGIPPAQPNCDYAPGAGFIYLLFSTLAACTEPVALFATGMFLMFKNPVSCGWLRAIGYMVVKLIIVPALMVGCAFAVGLEGVYARAAVLLASLPTSAAAFALSDKYKICTAEAVANIFWGNLLVLPTTLAWMAFMDGVDLFPVNKLPVPNVCAAPPAAG